MGTFLLTSVVLCNYYFILKCVHYFQDTLGQEGRRCSCIQLLDSRFSPLFSFPSILSPALFFILGCFITALFSHRSSQHPPPPPPHTHTHSSSSSPSLVCLLLRSPCSRRPPPFSFPLVRPSSSTDEETPYETRGIVSPLGLPQALFNI